MCSHITQLLCGDHALQVAIHELHQLYMASIVRNVIALVPIRKSKHFQLNLYILLIVRYIDFRDIKM